MQKQRTDFCREQELEFIVAKRNWLKRNVGKS
ncbi:hypothetical protein BN8_04416 [Fibrisoma limi BUZ 3]|uniref:Uncharacterized protein n=1 Tax=Fibrisoma limi BUZ 3 TaxID=1185876 RepID=I2GMP8_9BACT|nr:hypothetical protein BN8_04416 [Fibrisoma limi BUZ 3]